MQLQEQPTDQADAIDLMVNMGPQHPSTHGVFRLVIWVDGERIVRSESHIGYLHRGSEKLCEGEQYSQIITLFDRLDYVANLNCELAICMAVEKLMGVEVPERAEYIRVILCELNRIASHMMFYGVYGLDAGAMTPVLYGFRERERIQALFESVTGARMMHNYIRIGGVNEDIPDDFSRRMATLIDQLERGIEECDDLLSQNEMFLARTKGIGVISAKEAIDLGRYGPGATRMWRPGRRESLGALLHLRQVRLRDTCWNAGRLLGPLLRAGGRDASVAEYHQTGDAKPARRRDSG